MSAARKLAVVLLAIGVAACPGGEAPAPDGSPDGAADAPAPDRGPPPDDGDDAAAATDVAVDASDAAADVATGMDATDVPAPEDAAQDVRPPTDATTDTAEDVADDTSSPDAAPVAADAAPDAPGPRCEWIDVTMCGGTTPISGFCPAGRVAERLERCDGSLYTPDDAYRSQPSLGVSGHLPHLPDARCLATRRVLLAVDELRHKHARGIDGRSARAEYSIRSGSHRA